MRLLSAVVVPVVVAVVVPGALGACQQGPAASSPSPAPPGPRLAPATPNPKPAPGSDHTPFVIANRIVAEDGHVVRTLAGVSAGSQAVPDGPHRFVVEGRVVDTAADTVTPEHAPVVFERHRASRALDSDRYEVVRVEPDGSRRWAATLHGVRSVRPPDLAVGSVRVVATIDQTIHAFDDKTGKEVWSAALEGDNLLIVGDAVYSTWCNEPTHDHWLIATALADGKVRFKAPLAESCDPAILVAGDRIFAVESHPPATTRVFDLAGHLVTTLAEQVEAAQTVGGQLVVVSDQHVLSLEPSGAVRWSRPAPPNGFVGGDQIIELAGGDVLLANYGEISDSGVDLVRLHPDGFDRVALVRGGARRRPLRVPPPRLRRAAR